MRYFYIERHEVYNCILCFNSYEPRAGALKTSLALAVLADAFTLKIKESKKFNKVAILCNYLTNFVVTKYYCLKIKNPQYCKYRGFKMYHYRLIIRLINFHKKDDFLTGTTSCSSLIRIPLEVYL